MIDAKEAAALVEKMEGLRGFPDGKPEAIKEIILALRCADSINAARRVVDEFVHWGNGFCPAPSEIRKAIFASRPPEPPSFKTTGDEVGPTSSKAVQVKNGYSCGFVCQGWGTVGERPNVTWCTCDHARWLQREIPNWLDIANSMPKEGMNRTAVPRSFSGRFRGEKWVGNTDPYSRSKRARVAVREPGDESENDE